MRPFCSLVGQVFGRLTVTEQMPSIRGRAIWRCVCSCGAKTEVRTDGLRSGDHVSCGCKKVEQLTTHGWTGTAEHRAWSSMIERCHTPSHQSFARYGGRGIYVCDGWRNSFEEFIAHIGPRPGAAFSLDRIDNDLGYSPGNVRWATSKVQTNNRSTSLHIKVSGELISIAEAARMHGVSPDKIRQRLRRGWAVDKAIGVSPCSF